MSHDVARREMVERVRVSAGPVSDAVLRAFLDVPRHRFLPDVPAETAYQDEAIVTKRDADGLPISSSSQPTIMAIMLDQLDLRPGHRVLEIGAGTGYNAALMDRLVGPPGRVVTLDIDEDLVERAREHLAGTTVTVVRTDGALGHPEGAPYDRIIATVGTWDLLPAWTEQLAPGGRIVIPLDLGGIQASVAFERVDGRWESRSVVSCGFMRMRGSEAGPEINATVDGDVKVMLPEGGVVPPEFSRWLSAAEPFAAVDVDYEFHLWLGIRADGLCTISAPATDPRLAGAPIHFGDIAFTFGLLRPDGLAFLASTVMYAGPAGRVLAEAVVAAAQQWNEAGRPSTSSLRITAVPLSADVSGLSLTKRHTRMALSWESA